MEKGIKLVFIAAEGLLPRHLEYFYLDELRNSFDIEFWNCSSLLHSSRHQIESKIERPYVVKINSLYQLNYNLRQLPQKSLIVYHSATATMNFLFNIVLSKYFRNLIFIQPQRIIPLSNDKVTTIINTTECEKKYEKESKIRKIKEYASRYKANRLCYKLIFHPSEIKERLQTYWINRKRNMFTWHYISCVPNSKYRINYSNVDIYMKYKNELHEDKRFIVYIDQCFPYHFELKFSNPHANIDAIAKSHYRKLNQFFEVIEGQMGCPVVIAAHPLSKFSSNPFNGREIQYAATGKLIATCQAVLMHTSGSIDYVMLNNKPVAMLLDKEFKESSWYSRMRVIHNQFGIDIIDIESDSDSITIKKMPEEVRIKHVKESYGEIDESTYKFNDVLIKKNLMELYHEIYEKCSLI